MSASNQEILEKAIQKAIDGGWKQNLSWIHGNIKDKTATFMHWVSNLDLNNYHAYYDYDEFFCIYELIFNHDFAKALWGDVAHDADVGTYDVEWNRCSKCGGNDFLIDYCWQYHLMQMVIADYPIKYLGENLS